MRQVPFQFAVFSEIKHDGLNQTVRIFVFMFKLAMFLSICPPSTFFRCFMSISGADEGP